MYLHINKFLIANFVSQRTAVILSTKTTVICVVSAHKQNEEGTNKLLEYKENPRCSCSVQFYELL